MSKFIVAKVTLGTAVTVVIVVTVVTVVTLLPEEPNSSFNVKMKEVTIFAVLIILTVVAVVIVVNCNIYILYRLNIIHYTSFLINDPIFLLYGLEGKKRKL